MLRKVQLDARPALRDTLVRATELAGFTLDNAGIVSVHDDLFRATQAPGPMAAFVHVIFDDDALSAADVCAQVSQTALHLEGHDVEVYVHECVVLIPDFSEEDWIEDIWSAAERLHALERRIALGESGDVERDAQALRDMIDPLVRAQNAQSAQMTDLLATMTQLASGTSVTAPPTDGAPVSATSVLGSLASHLRTRKS